MFKYFIKCMCFLSRIIVFSIIYIILIGILIVVIIAHPAVLTDVLSSHYLIFRGLLLLEEPSSRSCAVESLMFY